MEMLLAVIVVLKSLQLLRQIDWLCCASLTGACQKHTSANTSHEGKMGNVVQSGRQRKAKPEQTLAVVRAAGAFKAKLKQSKTKTTAQQIEEILEWKFRKRKAGARKLDSINELQEKTKDNIEPSKEVLKFLRR